MTVTFPPSSLVFSAQPAWLESLRIGTDWLARCFGVDLEEHRKQVAAAKASTEVLRRMLFQSQVAGCRKTRSQRWNNAHFLRWIEYHAAAFDVVYGKLTTGISVPAARSFVRNFHYVEYLLAKRHLVLMENWSQHHRDKMCQLLQDDDRSFSRVRRFHKLPHKRRRTFMCELDAAFSAMVAIPDPD